MGGEVKVDFDLDDGSVLSGRVTRHGEPVPGVMLNVMGGSNESSATTDADGSYRCRVPDGSYELTVYTMERQRREFEIVIQGATTFDIELGGGGLIGRVFDRATGKPISGVEVEVEHISPNGQGLGSSDLKTDSTGIFRFADLPAGPQMVRVAHPDYAQHRRNLELSNRQVVGPGGDILDPGDRLIEFDLGDSVAPASDVLLPRRHDEFGETLVRPLRTDNQRSTRVQTDDDFV